MQECFVINTFISLSIRLINRIKIVNNLRFCLKNFFTQGFGGPFEYFKRVFAVFFLLIARERAD